MVTRNSFFNRLGVALLLPWLVVSSPASGLPSLEVFYKQLQSQMRQTRKPRPGAENPQGYDYVLVGGLIADYLHRVGYFSIFRSELKEQGVPGNQIHLLFPPSDLSVEDNAESAIPEKWGAISAKSDRPIVIVAHSKGAVETVEFLLRNPQVLERVEAVFCLQGAFGGSELADFLMKEYEAPGRPDSWWARSGMRAIRTLDGFLHGRIAGVESLTTARARDRVLGWYRERPDALKKLIPKLVFITTNADPKTMDLRTRVGGRYLSSVGALENDGAVAEKNQFIPGLSNRSISITGIDHALPCGNLLARRHFDTAKSFVRAIIRSVGF